MSMCEFDYDDFKCMSENKREKKYKILKSNVNKVSKNETEIKKEYANIDKLLKKERNLANINDKNILDVYAYNSLALEALQNEFKFVKYLRNVYKVFAKITINQINKCDVNYTYKNFYVVASRDYFAEAMRLNDFAKSTYENNIKLQLLAYLGIIEFANIKRNRIKCKSLRYINGNGYDVSNINCYIFKKIDYKAVRKQCIKFEQAKLKISELNLNKISRVLSKNKKHKECNAEKYEKYQDYCEKYNIF